MKHLLKTSLFISALASSAIAATDIAPLAPYAAPIPIAAPSETPAPPPPLPDQDAYALTCKINEICFDQRVKKVKHEFTIEPGSIVRVEAKSKSGVSVTVKTTESARMASYIQLGNNVSTQEVDLEADVPKDGKFSIEAEPARVTVNGVEEKEDTYSLKITRIALPHQNAPGESI